MVKNIAYKRYYKIEFKLASALSVGGNSSYATDKDIIYNGKGIPYIPATSLAGIYRGFFDEKTANKYFGNKNVNNITESKIYVYDAEMKNDKYNVSKRDCVGLDKWKTSIKGAKFDFEIIEPGAEFVTYIEQDVWENKVDDEVIIDENVSDLIADMWFENKIRIGGKTTRGLGAVKDVTVKMKSFSFKSADEKNEWLDFDVFDDNAWNGAIIWNSENDNTEHWSYCAKNDTIKIKLDMDLISPITVRKYTTEVSEADYMQLTFKRYGANGEENVPVIPGTSWAGTFRHHIVDRLKMCSNEAVNKAFGYCDKASSKKSSIIFSESIIEGGKSKLVSRNSIDRFTGGTVENALFTEIVHYGGKTLLEIEISKACGEDFFKAIAVTIVDINEGFVAVGGETSIGHGIFKITGIECNGRKIEMSPNPEKLYDNIISKIFDEGRGEIV